MVLKLGDGLSIKLEKYYITIRWERNIFVDIERRVTCISICVWYKKRKEIVVFIFQAK